MITRILKPEERYRAALTIATAYERPLDFEKEKEACLSLTQAQKDNILHPKGTQEPALPSEVIQSPKYWATLTDDEETLYSCLDISTLVSEPGTAWCGWLMWNAPFRSVAAKERAA
jgi:hypothetical protein